MAHGDGVPRKLVKIREQPVHIEDGVVRSESGGGWSASEILNVDNGMSEEARAAGGKPVIEAVRESRKEEGARSPKHGPTIPLTAFGQPFAIFHHPSEFTEEEDAVIVNGLMASLPLYIIASKLNCTRALLSRHIKESKMLSQVWEDAQESFIDNVEWQAKRLIDSGNPAMIMFALDRKGKSRGWGSEPETDRMEDESRIVIGEISDEEVEAADAKVKALEMEAGVGDGHPTPPKGEGAGSGTGDGNGKVDMGADVEMSASGAAGMANGTAAGGGNGIKVGAPDPMEMAMEQVREEERERKRMENTITLGDGDVQVGPAPWDDGNYSGFGDGGGGSPFEGGFDGFM